MKKPQAIQISIPQPCSEDWHKMTPQDQGHYCDACKKCVVDFTGFSDRQLYDYFKEHEAEKVCGHFKRTQLNRSIIISPQPHSKLYRIAIALGLAIAIVTTTEQQSFAKAPRIEYNFINNYHTDDTTQNNRDTTYATIKGQVVDENGEPLINAVVELSLGGVVKAGIVTDYEGQYILKVPIDSNEYKLKVQYASFITYNKSMYINKPTKTVNIALNKDPKSKNIQIVTYGKILLIDPDNPSAANKNITSEEINRTAH